MSGHPCFLAANRCPFVARNRVPPEQQAAKLQARDAADRSRVSPSLRARGLRKAASFFTPPGGVCICVRYERGSYHLSSRLQAEIACPRRCRKQVTQRYRVDTPQKHRPANQTTAPLAHSLPTSVPLQNAFRARRASPNRLRRSYPCPKKGVGVAFADDTRQRSGLCVTAPRVAKRGHGCRLEARSRMSHGRCRRSAEKRRSPGRQDELSGVGKAEPEPARRKAQSSRGTSDSKAPPRPAHAQ
ncbi:hypothetical protein ERJ75_001845200 [Trypanosoma vivax]|nr:hypothetical protein ERJ75_001845200 [Trypanosoma vivax]